MRFKKTLLAGALLAVIGLAPAAAETRGSSVALRESYVGVRNDLEHSALGRPLRLVSDQSANTLRGDIHAIVEQPFATVRTALGSAKNWCDILILDPNITQCRLQAPSATKPEQTVEVTFGRWGSPVAFDFRVAKSEADYMEITLNADKGPFGTENFRISLDATPLPPQRTFMRLLFSHRFGLETEIALRAYHATLGRNKVGFTVVRETPDGKPVHVGDLRGALERNAMRYYLAIEAYLESPQQFERRLQTWYASAERYPLQLHEDPAYLDRKRRIAAAS